MTEKQIEILHNAIQTFGKQSQVDKAIEEMAELTKELLKERQNNGSAEHIMEELADVLIMMYQLMMIFGITDYDHCVDYKIKRLERRLNKIGGD
jgi:NTP pyrophosphatase (non-canonical NTP hydrolase)